ncbi:MAG: PhoH family protein [Bacilli bacterium]|nr:PhoH family protein [Bacilli bacterium]
MKDCASPYTIFGVDFADNPEQKELIRLIREDPSRRPLVYCDGDAGTGKTFTALAACLSLIRAHGDKKRRYKNLYYLREPVEVGHHLGYLKGTEDDKFAPYLGPLLDNYNHLMAFARAAGIIPPRLRRYEKNKDDNAPQAGSIVYSHLPSDIIPIPPEYIRGRSFEDCLLIVDEAQNMSLAELQTAVTRIGENSKMIILGSGNQIDIEKGTAEENDFLLSYAILKPTKLVGYVHLVTPMRSSFVAAFDERFVEYRKLHPKRNGK